jgi:hypothetical protein
MSKAKISYKKAYHDVVNPENLEKIKTLLKERGSYDPETIDNIRYHEQNNLPYLLVQVDSGTHLGQGNYGMVDGIFVNLEAIYPQWSGVFYLPIVFLRHPANPKLKELVEKRNIKEHELGHLQDLIEYINKTPSYINRALKFSLSACTLQNVRMSIHFEVEKVFQKEAPLLAKDYQRGETSVSISADGAVYEIEVDTEERYVEYEIGLYLGSLFEQYLKKFPDHKKLIEEFYEKEVNAQGRALFGKNAIEKIALAIVDLFNQRFNPLKAARYEIENIE